MLRLAMECTSWALNAHSACVAHDSWLHELLGKEVNEGTAFIYSRFACWAASCTNDLVEAVDSSCHSTLRNCCLGWEPPLEKGLSIFVHLFKWGYILIVSKNLPVDSGILFFRFRFLKIKKCHHRKLARMTVWHVIRAISSDISESESFKKKSYCKVYV